MRRSALFILLVITFNLVGGQINTSTRHLNSQATDNYLFFCSWNPGKYFKNNCTPVTANYLLYERPDFSHTPTASLSLPGLGNSGNNTLILRGKHPQGLSPLNPDPPFRILALEFDNLSANTASNAPGAAFQTNHFVSYYPGLLNEKIL